MEVHIFLKIKFFTRSSGGKKSPILWNDSSGSSNNDTMSKFYLHNEDM